jgi:hypothetical protein
MARANITLCHTQTEMNEQVLGLGLLSESISRSACAAAMMALANFAIAKRGWRLWQ